MNHTDCSTCQHKLSTSYFVIQYRGRIEAPLKLRPNGTVQIYYYQNHHHLAALEAARRR